MIGPKSDRPKSAAIRFMTYILDFGFNKHSTLACFRSKDDHIQSNQLFEYYDLGFERFIFGFEFKFQLHKN